MLRGRRELPPVRRSAFGDPEVLGPEIGSEPALQRGVRRRGVIVTATALRGRVAHLVRGRFGHGPSNVRVRGQVRTEVRTRPRKKLILAAI